MEMVGKLKSLDATDKELTTKLGDANLKSTFSMPEGFE